MNQSIQFPDQQAWLEGEQVVTFTALNAGQLIECRVSLAYLQKHGTLTQSNEAGILTLFEQLRFDLEEIAEVRIIDEDFQDDGSIKLG